MAPIGTSLTGGSWPMSDMLRWKDELDRLPADHPIGDVIVASWERSAAAGVERDGPLRLHRLADDETRARLDASAGWLAIAETHLHWLSTSLSGIPHVAYVTDRDGVVLCSLGDRQIADAYGLHPGFDWSEARMGTNGAGTALAARCPVAVVGPEHFIGVFADCICTGAPIFDADGELLGAVDVSTAMERRATARLALVAHIAHCITTEVSLAQRERRLTDAQQSLQSAHAELRALAEELLRRQVLLDTAVAASRGGVFRWDPRAARFLEFDANLSGLFGLPAEQDPPSLERFLDRVHDDDRETVLAEFAQLTVVEALETEFRIVRPDGELRWLLGRAGVHEDSRGCRSLIGVCTDITRQKLAEAELQQADRRKDVFLATLAHELRNPLQTIRCGVDLLGAPGDQARLDDVRRMLSRQARHLDRLVNDLVDLARVREGKLELELQRVTLRDVVDTAIESNRPRLDRQQQALTLEHGGECCDVRADPDRLVQIVSNLLGNASKFSPPGSPIGVCIGRDGPWATVSVRDAGDGIADNELERIFDLFGQASRRVGSDPGLGIGLSLVRRLARLHGGDVQARSDGPGRGSEFVLRLPVA